MFTKENGHQGHLARSKNIKGAVKIMKVKVYQDVKRRGSARKFERGRDTDHRGCKDVNELVRADVCVVPISLGRFVVNLIFLYVGTLCD